MERRPKTIFQLDTPFSTVQWPTISLKDQETILELLCSLLSPIGHHKSNHLVLSKGKRSKKRKRQQEANKEPQAIPPAPEITSSLLIGFNSTNRHLEANAAKCKRARSKSNLTEGANASVQEDKFLSNSGDPSQDSRHVAAIFVARSTQPSVLHAHLPPLVATASHAFPDQSPTRLVQLPKNCEARLATVLGIPRVNFIGLLADAPHSKALLDVVRESVTEIDAPWLREIKEVAYLPTKINAIETFMPVASKVKT